MARQRSIEIRVGIFLLVSLVVIAGLIIKFGKYARLGEKTYEISVLFPNVGGIVRDASVVYAGIPIGKVRAISLVEDHRLQVKLTLAIYEGYKIHKDASFVINQSGLLGDRYVDVVPRGTTAPVVQPGDQLEGMTSVDLSEAIRGVVDVLHQAAGTIARVDTMIQRVDEMVLNTQNLTRVSESLANIDTATSNTALLAVTLNGIVETNRSKLDQALSELADSARDFSAVSKHAEELVGRVDSMVVTDAPEIHAAITNVAASAVRLNTILTRVENGEGTVGKLLVDPKLHDELIDLIEKINRYGLFYGTWIGPKPDHPSRRKGASAPRSEPAKPPASNFRP